MAPARWLQKPDISAIVPSREVGFKGMAGEGDDVQHFFHLSVKFSKHRYRHILVYLVTQVTQWDSR